ncbi:MAG: dihydrofolate reductase family protein [Deltaproteobacteria bacterium]|nr:dihydrofolate reductase family protein [Deltaproteobacteria bacterium]
MGARTVLIEGGAMLNYAALSEGVVDEIYLTIVTFALLNLQMKGLKDDHQRPRKYRAGGRRPKQ